MPDLLSLQRSIDKFNEVSVPLLLAMMEKLIDHMDEKLDEDLKQLIDGLHGFLDRLNGTSITVPERKP